MTKEEAIKRANEIIPCNCNICRDTKEITIDCFLNNRDVHLPCPVTCKSIREDA